MRTLLVWLLLASPVWAQQYPPESPPLEPVTRALWVELVPDVLPEQDASQQIDVLYILSSSYQTNQATADTLCGQYEARENEVLANDPANISRVHKVACKIITYTAVNSNTDFNWIAGGAGHAQAEAWRNQYGADVVQFITNATDSCGLGWQCAANSGQQYGYSWIAQACAIGNYSIIHELGHNVCLAHDLPNQNPPSYPYGSGFCDAAHLRRDPMVYPQPCGGSRVSYFGNPNISPFGYPFGDATCCNNARVWREKAAAVAAFRAPITPPTCPTITLVPSTLANGYTGRAYSQTFTATGGTSPYTFAVTAGTVPAGTTFSVATLSGTPTTAGTSTFTVRATDTAACTGSQAYSLPILQLPNAPTNLVAVP